MRSFLLLVIFSFTCYAQLFFEPFVNISNTGWATSDYHSVNSHDLLTGPDQFNVIWGDNGEIMFRKSTDVGLTWSQNKIISTTENPCGWPVIAGTEQGNLAVLYHTLASGGNYEVIFQKSIDGGINWTPMQKISGSASAITPQLIAAGPQLFAVWEERPNNNYEIYYSKSSDFGTTWTAPLNISNTPATSRWVQIAMHGQLLMAAWIEMTSYPYSDIYFTTSTDGGTTWSPAVNITNDSRPQNRFYMFEDVMSSTIYLACNDIPSPPTYNFDEIYLIKSTDFGATWSSAVNITNNSGNSNTPCIYAWLDYVFFTWSDNTHSAPLYDNSDIYFKMSTDRGASWGETINLSQNPESSSRPRICFANWYPSTTDFTFNVVWYDYSTGDAEILSRRAVLYTPVELTSFKAESEGNNVNLSWITASETNNRGFEVERRNSDGEWNIIGFVEGKGTSSGINRYNFADANLSAGKYFYRLRQIDLNGSSYFSDEVNTDVSLPAEFYLAQNYPNPFNPVTTIKYNIPSGSAVPVKMVIYDVTGKETAVLVNEQKSPGEYTVKFDGGNLPSGIYLCRLSASGYDTVIKISLLK